MEGMALSASWLLDSQVCPLQPLCLFPCTAFPVSQINQNVSPLFSLFLHAPGPYHQHQPVSFCSQSSQSWFPLLFAPTSMRYGCSLFSASLPQLNTSNLNYAYRYLPPPPQQATFQPFSQALSWALLHSLSHKTFHTQPGYRFSLGFQTAHSNVFLSFCPTPSHVFSFCFLILVFKVLRTRRKGCPPWRSVKHPHTFKYCDT